MTKKKASRSKHQKDASFGDTSEEEYNTVNVPGKSCPHVARGIHFGQVKKSLKSSQSIVTCSGCFDDTIDTDLPEVWLCLRCGYRGCGRTSEKKHGLQHFKTLHSDCHSLVLSTTSSSVWCYDCDDEVSLQSSRILKQCVEFVMKMAPSASKPKVLSVNRFASQNNLQSSVIKEETVVQNSETSGPVEKIKRPIKSNKEISAKIPIKGLRNLGNTCFFNAVMQNLNQTSLLYHELKNTCNPSHLWEVPELTVTNSEITEKENANTIKLSLLRQFPLTNALLNFFEQMSAASSAKMDIINPSPLFGEISKKCPQFRHFQQQDSHELLRQLLDGVRQEEIKRQKKAILRHFDLEKVNPEEVDEETKKQIKAYGFYASHTVIEKIFGGLLISTVLCEECKMSSQVFEPFMDLSLPLFEEKPLRNRKMEWESDENSPGEYPLTKPKNDLGKPSKHQEKKQKQLARKEKKRTKYSARNKKNSVDLSDGSQLPVASENAKEEEDDKEFVASENAKEEDDKESKEDISNEEEEAWELKALLDPEEDSESTVPTQNPNLECRIESSDLPSKDDNVNLKTLSQGKIFDASNDVEMSVIIDNRDDNSDGEAASKTWKLPEDKELSADGSSEKSTESVIKTCNSYEMSKPIDLNENRNEVRKSDFSIHSLVNENETKSFDLAAEKTNSNSPGYISQMQVCKTELNDSAVKTFITVDDSLIGSYDRSPSIRRDVNGDVKDIFDIRSSAANDLREAEKQEQLSMSEHVVSNETLNYVDGKDQYDPVQNGDADQGANQNGDADQGSIEKPNLDDSLRGLVQEFSSQLKLSDTTQSSLDDRIQTLSMQVKDVRIRRDSDRQENLLNSSESADECESQKTNYTSPKSSIEDTCSIENGDNWSHSVSEQQTKDWISKTLTTLKSRHHVSPLECSVNSCLSQFTKPELLTGNNKFRCENCTQLKIRKTGNKKEVVYSNASKQLLIFSPPAVLTLHLKRFQQVGMSLRKVNRFVEFPLLLDLAPFCCSACKILPHLSSTEDELLYSLYGIVEHSGRLTSGHYTAYVKANKRTVNKAFECQLPLSQCDLQQLLQKFSTVVKDSVPNICEETTENRQWYYISDSHVKEVSEAQVLKCQAYLLFYERIK